MDLRLELHEKQGRAFQASATEVLYGGAAAGGKSHLLRVAAIAWCYAIPGLQVYLFRRKGPDLYKNHLVGPGSFPELLAPWVKNGFARIVYSQPGRIHIGKSSIIHLAHCEQEKHKYNYQGADIHVLMPDELTHFTQSQYAYLRSRVRLGSLVVPEQYRGHFPRVLAASNPGNIGHNWVKDAWIDQAKPMEAWRAPKGDGGMVRQFIPARLEDNPTMLLNDPEYADKLQGLGNPELVRAMLEGDWDIVAGGMFDDIWRRDAHVIEPFPIPPSWYVDRSLDWGDSAPFSVGFWAESDGTDARMADGSRRSFPRETLFRVDELYGWNGKPNEGCRKTAREVAREVKAREAELRLRVMPGPADTQIFSRINGQAIADDFIAEGVNWTEANKEPGSRKAGWQILRQRLKSAHDRADEPGLYVFNRCKAGFIRTIPVLPRSDRDPDDVAAGAEDHCGDEVRYRLLTKRHEMRELDVW